MLLNQQVICETWMYKCIKNVYKWYNLLVEITPKGGKSHTDKVNEMKLLQKIVDSKCGKDESSKANME